MSERAGRKVRRASLDRERVFRGAMAVADVSGITGLTIRSLAKELGVKPMSLYHYVANKDEILDGVVDLVFSEIELPTPGGDWREELRRRAVSAREVLRRHTWAIALLDSRTTPGPATLQHHDAFIGTLRTAGFSIEMAAHAFAVLDAFVYGFALQEATLPFEGPEEVADIATSILEGFPLDRYPHIAEMATEHVLQPGYDFGDEFSFGLDLILDALETKALGRGFTRKRRTGTAPQP